MDILKVKVNDQWVGIPAIQGEAGEQGPKGDKGDPGDPATAPVQDVQVNGTSIVQNGVANVPYAGVDAGVVKIPSNNAYGLGMLSDGTVAIAMGSLNDIKNGSGYYKPIVPTSQHQSAFYGLAKAAGDSTQSSSSNTVGTYTESAKSSISQMLDAPETVSGTTPSITAKAGIRYICGEVSTLSVTVPESGDIEVIFDSGSTPTVLTITPPTGVTEVKFPEWFDSTSLEANMTYDIIITNGKYGVVASWT